MHIPLCSVPRAALGLSDHCLVHLIPTYRQKLKSAKPVLRAVKRLAYSWVNIKWCLSLSFFLSFFLSFLSFLFLFFLFSSFYFLLNCFSSFTFHIYNLVFVFYIFLHILQLLVKITFKKIHYYFCVPFRKPFSFFFFFKCVFIVFIKF